MCCIIKYADEHVQGTLRNSITAQRGIFTSLISYLAAGAVEQSSDKSRAESRSHQLGETSKNVALFYSALKQHYVVFLPQNDSIKTILTIQ